MVALLTFFALDDHHGRFWLADASLGHDAGDLAAKPAMGLDLGAIDVDRDGVRGFDGCFAAIAIFGHELSTFFAFSDADERLLFGQARVDGHLLCDSLFDLSLGGCLCRRFLDRCR